MSNRFHNKWHRVSHHTYKDPNIIDAGWDPIASHENPFKGDFVIDGSIEGSLFSKDLYAIHLYPGNDTVDWHTDTITAYSNFVVTGNETVGGNTSGHGWIKTDSYLYALGADNNGYGLVVDKKARVDGETVLNDKTYVTKNGLFVTGDSEFKDDLTVDQQITVKGPNNNYISGGVRVGKSISAHDYIKTDADVSARDIYATNNIYVGNDLDVNNTLTAYDIVVKHHLSAVSATIHHVDITASEGKGFIVTGYAPGEEIPSDYFEIPSQPVVGGVKNIYLDKVGLYVDGWAMFKGETEFEHQLILQTDGKVDVGSSFSGGVKTTVYRTDTIVNYPSGGGEYEFHYPNESGILALIENIAPDFDEQATYAIGQLVVYNRKLYRCIATHSGPWNDAHFEETTVEFSMPWAIGEGDDSVVQKQSTADPIVGLTVGNRAISQSSIGEGAGNFAGLKGYRYTNTGSVTNSLTFEVVPEGWAAGDVVSIVNNSKYADCATIASISGTTVTFTENLPFDSIVDESDWDSKTAYVSAKPSAGNVDLGYGAHVEGVGSKALNAAAHAEGRQTEALGQYAHAEGRDTKAQYAAHAEGESTIASGARSHTEGMDTTASGSSSHAEGQHTRAAGQASHVEGHSGTAVTDVTINKNVDGIIADWEQQKFSLAKGTASHVEGKDNLGLGEYSHAEGLQTTALGPRAHAEGSGTFADGNNAHAEGGGTKATMENSHAEGSGTIASGNRSHAEGSDSEASSNNSHAEGMNTKACSNSAHAEGTNTVAGDGTRPSVNTNTAEGNFSHAEGNGTFAKGNSSHAEGKSTQALKPYSHAEGLSTTADGNKSHAEGWQTTAGGEDSHAEGGNTQTQNRYEHAQGSYNKSNKANTQFGNAGNTLHSIGIGTSDSNRKNAVEVMQNGKVFITGVGGYDGTNPTGSGVKDVATVINESESVVQVNADWNAEDGISQILNKPGSETAAQGGTKVSLVTTGEKFTWNGKQDALTDPQLAALSWAIEYRQQVLQSEALGRYTVSTSGSANRIADEATSITLTATVTTKFKNANNVDTFVDAVTPSGWTRTATGTYTKSVEGATGTVASATFRYTVDGEVNSKYEAIEVSKNSDAKSISVTYPIYHGFAPTNSPAGLTTDGILDISTLGLARGTAKVSNSSATLANNTGAVGYYWILTHNNATATQVGTSILNNPVTVKLRSPQTNHTDIVMDGYKLYISSNSVSAGGSIDRVALTINI